MIYQICYLNLGLKLKKHYILVTSILSRYLANNLDALKEHKSKIDLITLLREPSILSLSAEQCLYTSESSFRLELIL